MSIRTQHGFIAVLTALGLAINIQAAEPPRGQPGNVNYRRPFERPTRPVLIPLPPGAVEPAGWLRDWCVTAKDGYTGHMDEVHHAFRQAWAADYKMTGDKLFWEKGGWPYEGGGYWFDGLARLGFALHDESLVGQVKTRFNAVIDHMNDNGILFLWWLNMNNPEDVKAAEGRHYRECEWPVWSSGLLGRALAGYYAGSGDKRALQTLVSAYSNNSNWATMECWGVSNIWPAYQTYVWTGNTKIEQALNTFFSRQGDEKKNWSYQRYRRKPDEKSGTEKPDHGVHFYETTVAAAIEYLWTGKPDCLDAVLAWHDMIERQCMQPYGVYVTDEFYGPTGAFRCTETCNVPASIWNYLFLLGITGQGPFADKIERAFFNAGPATATRDFQNHVYFQSPNRMADKSLPRHGQCTYQRSHGPLCCTAATNRFLPLYVTHLWMATQDNGLAAVHYGPCCVSALVGNGVPVKIVCRTDYPFRDTIEMAVNPTREVAFPLSLRIPGWCKRAAITINGESAPATPNKDGAVRVERTWKTGDTVRLEFPMSVRLATGRDKNVKPEAPYATVSYGPLLMALPIADTTNANTPDPAARWNYAIDAQVEKQGADMSVERAAMPAKWDWPLQSPLKVRVPAVAFDWKPTVQQALPSAPVAGGPGETITLVPYGCTKFRVSMFPVTERVCKQGAPLP